MRQLLLTCAAAVLLSLLPACAASRAATVASPAEAAVLATVQHFVDGFNTGDVPGALSVCADAMSIIDEFPPHEWHGAGACANWLRDYETDAKANGISAGIVTLASPLHVDVSGDRAYVVAPADYAFQRRGVAVAEHGSLFTFALQKQAAGWRITGWSWSKT